MFSFFHVLIFPDSNFQFMILLYRKQALKAKKNLSEREQKKILRAKFLQALLFFVLRKILLTNQNFLRKEQNILTQEKFFFCKEI